jgi:hypothetical protein
MEKPCRRTGRCGGWRNLLLLWSTTTVDALKHSFTAKSDRRNLIAPVGVPFGFNQGGQVSLTVTDFSLVPLEYHTKTKDDDDFTQPGADHLDAGFWMQRFPNEAAFQRHQNTWQQNRTHCVFEYFRDNEDDQVVAGAQPEGLFLSLKDPSKWEEASLDYQFKEGEDGYYFLVYQVCARRSHPAEGINIFSNFHLEFHFINHDAFGNRSYLTAGELHLPLLFVLSALSFSMCALLWQWNLHRIRQGLPAIIRSKEEQAMPATLQPTIYAIHPMMGLLLWIKTLSVWAEAFRLHSIKTSGHAEVWSVLYYTLLFFKGTFLFTVVLLIGTGWSFVKPLLQAREKQIIFLVLLLQVLNQIALLFLSQETEGERQFGNWNAVLHLVDILCCCAVLLPTVWQVNAMEASLQAASDDDELTSNPPAQGAPSKMELLAKLKKFRLFYLLVIAYIYMTRIMIYLFATMLDYRHLWLRYAIVELVTLVFYVTVGLLFRPSVEDGPVVSGATDEEGIALIATTSSE